MKDIFESILASFTVTKKGLSAKKVTAFVIIMLVVASHICWLKHSYYKGDYSLLPEILVIDYSIVCACLGMATYEKIKIKNESGKEQSIKDNNINTD